MKGFRTSIMNVFKGLKKGMKDLNEKLRNDEKHGKNLMT